MNIMMPVALALTVIILYMTITFQVARLIKNYGIVDLAWSFGFTICAALYFQTRSAAENLTLSSPLVILCAMYVIWSLRLTWHLTIRFIRWYPHQDPRYAELANKMGSNVSGKMFLVYLWQGLIIVLLTLPLAVISAGGRSSIGPIQQAALGLWVLCLIGESTADWQLAKFNSNPQNKGKTCQLGLWSYSRHPNYFFEWLGSVALCLFSLFEPFGAFTLLCPLTLLHLLINVTGVKPAEENSLKHRTDYAQYIKTTSPFIPWFRRPIND